MWRVFDIFEPVEFVLIIGLIIGAVAIAMLITEVVRITWLCTQANRELIELRSKLVLLKAEILALETLIGTLKRVVRRLENAETPKG